MVKIFDDYIYMHPLEDNMEKINYIYAMILLVI